MPKYKKGKGAAGKKPAGAVPKGPAATKNPKEVDVLTTAIADKAEDLRKIKAAGASAAEVNAQIFNLLELKFAHPKEQHWCYSDQLDPHEPLPDKVFKLRWRIPKENGSGEKIRLQMPVKNKTSLTGGEIAKIVAEYTAKRHPELGGFVKLEFRDGDWGMPGDTRIHSAALEAHAPPPKVVKKKKKKAKKKATDGDKKEAAGPSAPRAKYLCVQTQDVFRLPLVTPGPRLADVCVLNFRATFAAFESVRTTPQVYTNLSQLPRLIDTGINLFDKPFAKDRDAVLARAVAAGVPDLINLSTSVEDVKQGLEYCQQHPSCLRMTVGIHPYNAHKTDMASFDFIRETVQEATAQHPSVVVAIGECGLDYKEDTTDDIKAKQKEWLTAQLTLAAELDLPVFLHERQAFEDFYPLLKEYRPRLPGCVINCFTGTMEEFQKYKELDVYFGITGVITDTKKGLHLPPLIADVPADRMILGTDAPYMLPFNMPRPFPKRNEPAFLPHVLVKLAELRAVPLDTAGLCGLAATCAENTRRLFPLLNADGIYDGRLSDDVEVLAAFATSPPPAVDTPDEDEGVAEEDLASMTDEALANKFGYTLKEGEHMFVHQLQAASTVYVATERDIRVLTNQATVLGQESPQFAKLLEDFQLLKISS